MPNDVNKGIRRSKAQLQSNQDLGEQVNVLIPYQELKLDRINLQITQELLKNPLVKTSYMAHKLDIPLSTIQRRRAALERSTLLTKRYEIDAKRYGFRIADITIATTNGACIRISKEIVEKYQSNVLEISARLGDPKVNHVISIIYKNSSEIYDILESTRSMNNVDNVEWSEIVSLLYKNESAIMQNLIDRSGCKNAITN